MFRETAIAVQIAAQSQSRGWDWAIGVLADAQHGAVARWQLLALGMSDGAIKKRVTRGRLRQIHAGVYAPGHKALTMKGRHSAAWLTGGEDAVLSYHSAAWLWEIPAPGGLFHLTLPDARRSRRSIRYHHHYLPADEVAEVDGLPVTTVARTLLDLAAVLPAFRLEKAIHQAEYRGLTDSPSLPDLIERYTGKRGLKSLRKILDLADLGESLTEADLEDQFRAFIDQYDLPRPTFSVPMTIDGLSIRADCVWHEQRLIVELDDRQSHDRTRAFESDRRRDRKLLRAGWYTARVTGRHLRHEREELAADFADLLRPQIPRN